MAYPPQKVHRSSFLPKFSQVMKPLNIPTSGNKNITWTGKDEKIISILTGCSWL